MSARWAPGVPTTTDWRGCATPGCQRRCWRGCTPRSAWTWAPAAPRRRRSASSPRSSRSPGAAPAAASARRTARSTHSDRCGPSVDREGDRGYLTPDRSRPPRRSGRRALLVRDLGGGRAAADPAAEAPPRPRPLRQGRRLGRDVELVAYGRLEVAHDQGHVVEHLDEVGVRPVAVEILEELVHRQGGVAYLAARQQPDLCQGQADLVGVAQG